LEVVYEGEVFSRLAQHRQNSDLSCGILDLHFV
jgi:hypothetical protein